MRIQIWRTEAIENILWATQAVIQAAAVVSEDNDRSIGYHRGFDQGFEIGLQRVTRSFDIKPLSLKIWSHKHIQNILLVAQAEIQTIAAASESKTQSAEYNQGFNQGLEAALWCVATSFGVSLFSSTEDSLSGKKLSANSATGTWFREDIQNILLAIQSVMQAAVPTSKNTIRPVEYKRGFESALRYVANSFGIRLLVSANVSSAKRTFLFWTRKDVEKKLFIAYQTIPATAITARGNAQSVAYWQGFKAALQSIAVSFGVRLSPEN